MCGRAITIKLSGLPLHTGDRRWTNYGRSRTTKHFHIHNQPASQPGIGAPPSAIAYSLDYSL